MNLESFPFYKDLEPQAKDFLQMSLKPVSVPKDSILFFQGDICDGILFLTSGEVRLYIQSDDADEITLYHLNPGEQCIVNTASTLSQTEAIATAITLTDINGYILDMYSVKELAHNSNVYQSYLFSIYTLQVPGLVSLSNTDKLKNLDKRVMQWIQNQNTKEITIMHEVIAEELDTAPELIVKILKSFENDGILQFSTEKIILL